MDYKRLKTQAARHAKRFEIPDNDLIKMSEEFRYFISNREKYKSGDLRCEIQDISRLQHQHWLIDRDWTDDEKKELGLSDDQTEFTKDEFNKIFSDLGNLMLDFSKGIKSED